MKKCNPHVIIAFAVRLVRINGLGSKTFNAAMRKEFPRITAHALHKAHQDAKILIAIERVTKHDLDLEL
jgi:hypothetical protein